MHSLSKKIDIKYRLDDLLVKYVLNGSNAYIMYHMAGIVQNSNF